MPDRKARVAVGEFIDGLSRIVGCLTDQPLLVTGHRVGQPHYVSFLPLRVPAPLRLQGIPSLVTIDIRIDYVVSPVPSVPEPFAVDVTGYSYRLLERSGREILAYHWHPIGPSPVTDPHLHLSSRVHPLLLDPAGNTLSLSNLHIPTGHVTLADIVRLLIAEVGVEPRRDDWAEVLATAGD